MSEKRIYYYLDHLLKQPICNIGRASNMLWIGFGDIVKDFDRKGNEVSKSTFSLHVQSTWRIVNKNKGEIVLAASDFYSPNSKTFLEKDFEWDIQGNNLFDEKAECWKNTNNQIFVREYKINKWGDLRLIFSNDEYLEVFVDSSNDTECWRLFKCAVNEEHLVVTGLGICYE